jgi:predicted Zn finger-like uncharacterized protein
MLIICPSCATAFRVNDTTLGSTGRQVRCAQCRTVWHATPESAVAEPAIALAEAGPAGGAEPSAADDWGAAFAEEARDKDKATDSGRGAPGRAEETAMTVADSPPIAPPEAAEPLSSAAGAGQSEAASTKTLRTDIESRAAQRRRRGISAARASGPRFRLPFPTTFALIGVAVLATFFLGREQVVRNVPETATVYEALGVPVNLRGVDFRDVKGATEIVDGVVVLVVEGNLVNISGRSVDLPRLRLAVRDATGKEIYTWTATAPKPQLAAGEAASFRSRLASPPPDGATIEVRFFTRQDAGGR